VPSQQPPAPREGRVGARTRCRRMKDVYPWHEKDRAVCSFAWLLPLPRRSVCQRRTPYPRTSRLMGGAVIQWRFGPNERRRVRSGHVTTRHEALQAFIQYATLDVDRKAARL